jgi:hypothetical protein
VVQIQGQRAAAGPPAPEANYLRQPDGRLLIVTLSGLILGLGGLDWEWTWVTLILYFTCIHSTLVLFGMYALIKAMNGQMWRFPLIGPAVDGKTVKIEKLQRYRLSRRSDFSRCSRHADLRSLPLRPDRAHAYF